MEKKDIKGLTKKMDLIMQSPEKLTIFANHETTKTKKKTLKKLEKSLLSKGYNVITLLCRDELLAYDVNKNLYFISSYELKEIQELAANIFIEKNTVVLIHTVFSKCMTQDDIMPLYLNFNYTNGRYNTKMVFYVMNENTDCVFDTYIGLNKNEYLIATEERTKKQPEYTYSSLIKKMANEYRKRNAFMILMQNFIGKDINEFFTDFITTSDETFYEYFCFDYLGSDVEYADDYELDGKVFKEFIIDMFDDELQPYFNNNLSLLHSVLREEITYLILDQLYKVGELQKEKNIYLDSNSYNDGVVFICYTKEDVTKHEEKPKVLHSYKATFDVLFKFILDNAKNKFTKMVEDFDKTEDVYLEDKKTEEDGQEEEVSTETNIDEKNFPIPANNKSTELEKFYILIEKAIYKMDRWMKLPDLEKLHRKHFERNTLRYLLYKKRKLKVDLFTKGMETLMKESIKEETIHECINPSVKQRLAILLIAMNDGAMYVEKTKYLYNQYKFEIVVTDMKISDYKPDVKRITIEYYLKSDKDNKLTISLFDLDIVDTINDINFN